jgi:hypothetical protein
MDLADRPIDLTGCWAKWQEKSFDPLVRTNMDTGEPKVRRRFTRTVRSAKVQVNYTKEDYYLFLEWFDNCRQGVLPTKMIEPSGVESVWRFATVPQYDWIDPRVVSVTVNIEQLPAWQ